MSPWIVLFPTFWLVLGACHPSAAPHASVHAPTVLSPARDAREPTQQQEQVALARLSEQAAGFIDAFSNHSALLTADGSTLVFLSNRGGGEYSLYSAPRADPAAEPRRLIEGTDRLAAVDLDHAREHLLFLMDHDRNEQRHLYGMRADGSELTRRVEAPPGASVDSWQLSRDDSVLVYLMSDQRSGRHTLFAAQPDGSAARAVHAFEGFAYVTDVDATGKVALVTHLESLSRRIAYRVDLVSGKITRVAPASGVDAMAQVKFGPRDASLLVVTDEGRDRTRLVLRSFRGEELAAYAPEGEVDMALLSPDARTIAVDVQVGSLCEVHLLEAETLALRAKVALPVGTVDRNRFSRDGRELTVGFTSANVPGDVYAVDVQTGRATLLRNESRRGLEQIANISFVHEDLPSVGGLRVPTDVYLPAGHSSAKLPVIVELHGGPASYTPVAYNALLAYRLAQGYAVVTPNIRGSMGFGSAYQKADDRELRPNAFEDMAAVHEWIRAQPWADPERIAFYGGSYGGYLVYVALTRQPERWAAGIALVGPVNLESFMASTTGEIRLAFREEFGDVERDRELLRSLSPIHAIDRVRAPLFVYQGENDPRVPRAESEQVVEALRTRGRPVTYMLAKGEGHSVALRENKLAFFAGTQLFLERALGL